MATILIVDDRPSNREFLVTLLGYGGHRLLEAGDGAEGLAVVRAERPDLVIADILMPTMDGYEFVRQLRADEAVAGTRVIFFTAHYHEPDARRLAAACGVTDVLTKPCEPEVVLRTVEAALGHSLAPAVDKPPPAETFDREHLHLLTDKLARQADEVRRTNERLTALVELGLELGSERDPARLLQVFCDAARRIVGARYAMVGVQEKAGPNYRHFFTNGMDLATAARVGRPGPLGGVLGSVLAAGRCFRAANHGRLDGVGVPPSFPLARSLLAAPVMSPAHVYGWVCLLDKVGGEAFTDEDEQLARVLAAQVGRIYENGSLYADLLRHSTRLAEEIAERERAEAALRAGEAYLQGFFEASSAGMSEVDAGTGRIVRVNATYCRMLGYAPDEILGLSPEDFVLPDDLPEMSASYAALREGQIEAYDAERRYRRKDGSELWAQLSAALVRDADGRPARIAAVLSDLTARKRAEAELRRTTELLKAVADGTTDAVFVKDRNGKYLLCNPATARVFGLHPGEVVGRTDAELFSPADAQVVAENDRRVLESGRTETSEEVLTAAGAIRTFLATKGPYRDANGGVAGVIGISRDITDRKQSEDALRLRDRAIQAVPQGVLITDPNQPDHPIIFASAGFERMTGYVAAECVGLNCRFLQGKDTDPGTVARLREAVRAGQPCRVEIVNYRKDGSPFWNELSITPVMDPAGRLTHFVGIQTDVTERKRREDELRRQAEVLRAVFGHIPVMIAFIGPDNALRMVNREWERQLGWTFEEARGRDMVAELYPDPGEQRRVIDYIRHPPPGWAAFRTRTRDGRTLDTEWVNVLLSDGTSIGFGLDVTARKQLEEQFRQAQKMEAVGRLAGGVAHDFNNLLTVINGYSDMVLDALPADEPRRGFVAAIRESGDRAARLTQQLLAFSRKAVIEPKVLDLNELVAETTKLLRRLIGEDIALAVVSDPAPVRIKADPGQLEQVVMNLAVNARDAMPAGGRLTVETRDVTIGDDDVRAHPGVKPGRYARLRVADTGHGMTEEVKNKIFEPFFTTKGVGKGTGLGLAVVHGVVEQCGGHIDVESTVGAGTRFTLLFPIALEASTGPASGVVRLAARGTETVLLVEDEDAVRTIARIALTMQGFTVLEAESGSDAIRLAEEHPGPIHMLVSDVVMPEIGGRQLAEAVRNRRPDVRVLYMSGYTDDAVTHHGVESTDAFIQKPFTPLGLARKVRAVLDGTA